VLLIAAALSVRVVKQYEQGVLFRLGKVIGTRPAGLRVIIPVIDVLRKVSLRIVTMPIQSQTLSETDKINLDIRKILDVSTVEWGVEVTLVELKDIQLPDSMKRAMARQAEAEREKRAKIINAEGESLAAAALGEASDTMMAHPLALQLRNLQSLVEIGVDKNTTVVFPAPLMTTIAELGSFLTREKAAATPPALRPA
jgi:regulator of protease activity HflC (stomatin/prohibitin superfamily)